MLSRGPCSAVAQLLLVWTAACGAGTDAVAPRPAPAPETKVEPERAMETTSAAASEPEPAAAPPPEVPIVYPSPRRVPNGSVARAAGPSPAPQDYCEAYLRGAPPPQRFNASIELRSNCIVFDGPSSDPGLSSADPLRPLAPPYRDVALLGATVPLDDDDGPDESWTAYEEIRVAIVTERGTFVDERGIEIARWLPASAVALRSAIVGDLIAGGEPEVRIVLERFVGADEGVPEQYRVIELICGFGGSGRLACARFESKLKMAEVPRSPVTAAALRRLVLP